MVWVPSNHLLSYFMHEMSHVVANHENNVAATVGVFPIPETELEEKYHNIFYIVQQPSTEVHRL